MKRLALLAGLTGFALSGCATTGGSGGTNQVITQVQAIAQQVCAFVPLASTITGILALGIPALATAEQVANAICQAVGTPPANNSKLKLSRRATPSVYGVPVHGHFVQ